MIEIPFLEYLNDDYDYSFLKQNINQFFITYDGKKIIDKSKARDNFREFITMMCKEFGEDVVVETGAFSHKSEYTRSTSNDSELTGRFHLDENTIIIMKRCCTLVYELQKNNIVSKGYINKFAFLMSVKKSNDYLSRYEEEKRLLDEFDSLAKETESLLGETRESVVKTRVNQSVFRKRLIDKYQVCCICGMENMDLLIASHIKPWKDSDLRQRVDLNNGLLLCANHDKLFDKGYITFSDNGQLMISKQLSRADIEKNHINLDFTLTLNVRQQKYMEYHRTKVFKDCLANNEV